MSNSKDFVFDRNSFIKETKLRLAQGHSVVISCPQSLETSTVAYEILRQLRVDGCYTAKANIDKTSTVVEFAIQLYKSILKNRDLGLDVLDCQTDPIALLETVFNIADEIAQQDNKRMVILLYAFQEVTRLNPSLTRRLRSIFQLQKNTTYFFLGSGSINTMFVDHHQPFYRFATSLQLPDDQS